MKISKQIEIPKFPVSLEEKFCFRTWRCTWRCTTQGCTPAPLVPLVWRGPFLLCGSWRLVRYAFLSEMAVGETLRSLGEKFSYCTWRCTTQGCTPSWIVQWSDQDPIRFPCLLDVCPRLGNFCCVVSPRWSARCGWTRWSEGVQKRQFPFPQTPYRSFGGLIGI